MNKLLLDTCVLLHFFLGDKEKDTVEKILEKIEKGQQIGYLSAVTITELISIISRKSESALVWNCLDYLFKHFVVVPLTPDIAVPAGFYKDKYRKLTNKFSIIDAIILSTAENISAALITSDLDFSKVTEVKVIKPEDLS